MWVVKLCVSFFLFISPADSFSPLTFQLQFQYGSGKCANRCVSLGTTNRCSRRVVSLQLHCNLLRELLGHPYLNMQVGLKEETDK